MVSLRQANVGNYMKKYSLPVIFTFYLNWDTSVLELFPAVIGQIPPLKFPHFFMTLSCTEAIQGFISHFHQYSLVDPSWGNIPSWVWQGVSHWFRKLRHRVGHHGHFYPRPVLAFGYCRCLRVCMCVCPCVCQSWACPCDNSSTV